VHLAIPAIAFSAPISLITQVFEESHSYSRIEMAGILLPEEFITKFLSIFEGGILHLAVNLLKSQNVVADIRGENARPAFGYGQNL
jgi:hypothetical protein